MKVLLLGPASSIHLLNWANALTERGLEVVVASQHEARSGYDSRVLHRRLPIKGKSGYYLNAPALRAMLRKEKPDLLHAHFASGYGTLGRLSRFSPYLLSVWGSDVYLFPERGGLARRILLANMAAPQRILSTSRHMAQVAEDLCGRKADVTPFGVDTARFLPGLVCERRTIGTVRGLEPVYGIDLLLRAFARLVAAPEAKDLRLLLVGDGPARAELEELASKLGIAGAVEFRGRLPHDAVPAALAEMKIFVALSRSESFCVAALEAEACGVPVVATRVGGIPEVVEDGKTGILVEAENPEAAASAIARLLADEGLRLGMAKAGPDFVARNYGKAACVDRMLAIYHDSLAEHRSAN